jgi:opacity protein-like surface antigen
MKSALIVGMSLLGLSAFAGVARADSNVTGNINFSIGQKFLNDDWKDLPGEGDRDFRDQFQLGVMFDMRPQSWPINVALDLLGSARKDNGDTGSTSELALGVRKYFMEQTAVRPFVGAGVSDISGQTSRRAEGSRVTVEDDAFGVWLMGGVLFRPTPHLNLGADLRYSEANITYLNKDVEAGGLSYGLFVGYGF